jgi:hypothetical protein
LLHTGSVSGAAAITLNLTSCQAGRVTALRCVDGTRYDLQLVTDRITAQASSGGLGTSVSTWNVLAAGSTASVSTLTLSAEFRWNPLGIPHNDFHVFDGSVLPGYVDGIVGSDVRNARQNAKCKWIRNELCILNFACCITRSLVHGYR